MKNKSIFKSKTFWFNIVAALSGVLLPAFNVPVDPAMMGAILGVGNIGLRSVTTTPVNLKGE